jgi:DNA-binding beta-propeller fold protein YncE
MDEQRFDAALRALGQASSRRQAVAGVLAALFGGRRLAAADTGTGKDRSKGKDRNRSTGTGKPGAEGPCGNGSRKANICTRNKDCCTGLCNTKAGKTNKDGRGRCRCVPRGAACRESRNCCNRLSCRDGVCATGGSGCTTDRDCTGATDTCTGGTCTCGGGAACAGGTPICSSGMCVACATDSDCSGVTPFCCVGSCAAVVWGNQTTFGSQGFDPNQFYQPPGVALSGDGLTAAVADTGNHRISVWTRTTATGTDWTPQTTFGSDSYGGSGSTEFDFPNAVALTGDGLTAVVADTNNYRISVWTRPGTTGGDATNWTNQTTFGDRDGPGPGQFTNPAGVALSVDGLTVAVADPGNNRISVWTRTTATGTDWTPQTTFGSQGSDPNQFSGPRGVALSVDGRTAVIADLNNNRISVWTITCPAEPVIA